MGGGSCVQQTGPEAPGAPPSPQVSPWQHCPALQPAPTLTSPRPAPAPGQQNHENHSQAQGKPWRLKVPGAGRGWGWFPRDMDQSCCGWGSQAVLVVWPRWASLNTSCCRKWRRAILTSCSYPRTWSCPPERQGRCLPSPTHTPASVAGLDQAALVLGHHPDPGSAA